MDAVLSVMMLTAIALLLGALFLWRRGGKPVRQVVLMVIMALVLMVNVAIWTLPDASGENPLEQVEAQQAAHGDS
ncbi:hypothetical protein MB02_14705 [Croceicoccus estronivorus]|uniref:hypothetical protein n=1 Tax=Croceicoccus estronivorus TaxID=1172626 RepID=UPI000833B878|nr:hypothetical protein [Croceicoccus estronivorus]OCC22678.1 hypothetical protein MB02_14705 [Croceicoccus estronivorus]